MNAHVQQPRVLVILLVAGLTLAAQADASPTAGGDSPGGGWIGLGITPVSQDTARHPWLHVRHVVAGSPAAAAGVSPQDLITRIDGRPVAFATDGDILKFFEKVSPGQRLSLTIVRAGTTRTLTVKARAIPPDVAARRQSSTPR